MPSGTIGASSFAYGGTAPAYNPTNNSLFIIGHDKQQQIAEIKIPQIINSAQLRNLAIASVLQQCALRTQHYVETHHQWQEQGRQLERLLQGVRRTSGTDASLMTHRQ